MVHLTLVVLVLLFALFARVQRCGICKLPFKRRYYEWTLDGGNFRACPNCNHKLERIKSALAFGQKTRLKFPEHHEIDWIKKPGQQQTKLTWLWLLLGGITTLLLVALVRWQQNSGAVPNSSPIQAPTTLAHVVDVMGPQGSQETFRSVEEAQREAVRRYPALSIKDSPFNSEFRSRYELYKKTRSDLLTDNSWPVRIAEEIARDQKTPSSIGAEKSSP